MGKQVRSERIFRADGRAAIFAMDHGVERGPSVFPGALIDPRAIISKIVDSGFDGIMMSKGAARITSDLWRNKTSLIMKLSGKDELRPIAERDVQSPIGTVTDAISFGADAVAVTVYWGSKFEDLMLDRLVKISRQCDRFGLPLIHLAYPRVSSGDSQSNYDPKVVQYAARLSFETGADAIKTYYTGDRESFASVVKAAGGVPVLLSGGRMKEDSSEFFDVLADVLSAGASGVVVGRNVFQHQDPAKMASAVVAMVHEEISAEEASRRVRNA